MSGCVPAAASRVRDCGNASPRFMRMTTNFIPCNKALQKTSQMPFAVVVQPMALLHAGEYPIPVLCCPPLCLPTHRGTRLPAYLG